MEHAPLLEEEGDEILQYDYYIQPKHSGNADRQYNVNRQHSPARSVRREYQREESPKPHARNSRKVIVVSKNNNATLIGWTIFCGFLAFAIVVTAIVLSAMYISEFNVQIDASLTIPTPHPTAALVSVPATSSPVTSTPTTRTPTAPPTKTPTTKVPTSEPTMEPTRAPTTKTPSASPSKMPTLAPTTLSPTRNPTKHPTDSPVIPTQSPTNTPSKQPTRVPTTEIPTVTPTTKTPTRSPTKSPTRLPTELPTDSPTEVPTDAPV